MLTRHDLLTVLYDSLKSLGGSATIIEVSKYIWDHYEKELRKSNNLFFTWQYDVRWAATMLRKKGEMKSSDISPKGLWELAII